MFKQRRKTSTEERERRTVKKKVFFSFYLPEGAMHAPAVIPPEPGPPARLHREPMSREAKAGDKNTGKRILTLEKIRLRPKIRLEREVELRFRTLGSKTNFKLSQER